MASEFGFKETGGIEFSSLLCDIAVKNCTMYKEKTQTNTNFFIVNSDVLDYRINGDEEVFFFANPFDDITPILVIKYGLEKGCKTFNMERSIKGGGNAKYKKS